MSFLIALLLRNFKTAAVTTVCHIRSQLAIRDHLWRMSPPLKNLDEEPHGLLEFHSFRNFQIVPAMCLHVAINMWTCLIYQARRSRYSAYSANLCGLPITKKIGEWMHALRYKIWIGLTVSYIADKLNIFVLVCALRMFETRVLVVVHFLLDVRDRWRSFLQLSMI